MSSYWYVYIVRCCDHSLYVGITTDLDRQVAEHNAGTASKYTRAKGPVRLVYWERLRSKTSATRREAAVKKLSKVLRERLVLGERGARLSFWEDMDRLPMPTVRHSGRPKRGGAC